MDPITIGLGVASLAGGLFGGKKKKVEPQMQDLRNPEQLAIDRFLSQFVTNYGPQYKPGQAYTGNRTAGMGANEGMTQDFLQRYLSQPDISSNTAAASSYLNKSLTGGFDPGTSDFYKALRTEAEYNRGNAIDQTRRETASRGKFFSSDALSREGDINAQTGNTLNTIMAELASKERGIQQQNFAATPGFERFMAGIPLDKATAASTIGAQPRLLKQEELERQYQDFIRQQEELGGVVGTARGINTRPVQESYNAYAPANPGLSSFLGPITNAFLNRL